MKRKHFSVEQIVAVLKQAELGMPVADVIRQVGMPSKRSIAGRSSMPAYNRIKSVNSSNCRRRMLGSRSWWRS